MDHQPRRRMKPPGASRKRKERERDTSSSASDDSATHGQLSAAGEGPKPAEPGGSDNKLLAGYLAYEFLRQGTLLGERYGSAEPPEPKSSAEAVGGKSKGRSFEELASILKVDGVHIPGILNPSQLARWIRM